jgi:SNF2 family DNA or RNA helicase
MEKYADIDFKRVRKVLKEITAIDRKLKYIIDSEKKQAQNIKTLSESVKEEIIREALSNVSIDQINADKKGIRVNLLKEVGIKNIQQILDMPYNRLIAINGIGEQTADKVKEIANKINRNTRQTIHLRIDVENKSVKSERLVHELYKFYNSSKLRDGCKQIYNLNHAPLIQDINHVKRTKNRLLWFFSLSRTKMRAVSAMNKLELTLSGEYSKSAMGIITAYNSIERIQSSEAWDDFIKNSSSYYVILEKISGEKLDKISTRGGLPEELVNQVDAYQLDTELLHVTLRNYQVFGAKYILNQKNTLLGDEMGLGKTVQSIAAMCDLKKKGKSHFLVVCPASVIINWIREIAKHSKLDVYKVHGHDRDNTFNEWLKNGGTAVTTYDTVSKLDGSEKIIIHMLIVDEAHYIKNPNTKRTKNILKYSENSEILLFMTGTPIENKVEEMQFLISCLQPNIANKIKDIKHLAGAPLFKKEIAPVYLRRIREDVLTELPDILEKEEWCSFNKQELEMYKRAVSSGNFMQMRQLSWHVQDIMDSNKAKRLIEICEDAKLQNRRVIVFSFFRNVIDKVVELLGDQSMGPITGSTSPLMRQEIIDSFSTSPAGTVLICQVIAGGVGLNIQSASTVIFCEPQIKPSIENQAISRVYRMGQMQKVVVHRLLTEDSVDERIMWLLKRKQEIFDSFAHKSSVAQASEKLTESTWINMVIKEERERLGIQPLTVH